MGSKRDNGVEPLPDLQRLTDRQLKELIARARAEWLARLRGAWDRGEPPEVDPLLVADAMLRRWELGRERR